MRFRWNEDDLFGVLSLGPVRLEVECWAVDDSPCACWSLRRGGRVVWAALARAGRA